MISKVNEESNNQHRGDSVNTSTSSFSPMTSTDGETQSNLTSVGGNDRYRNDISENDGHGQYSQVWQQQINHRQHTRHDQDVIDPPYSLTLVVVIALSAVVQIILQAIIFTALQFDMKSATEVLTLTYLTSFGFYIASVFCFRDTFVIGH